MSVPDLDGPQGGDQLMREAASWFARMRAPDADKSRADFESWLARGALHRSAYNRAAEIFAMGKLLDEREPQIPARAPARASARAIAAVLLCALCLGWLVSWLPALPGFADPAGTSGEAMTPQIFSSATGTTSILLADGSRLWLAPSTTVEVALGSAERRLELLHGRARFRVRHESRPFRVSAGGGLVTARGTLFEVALSRDRRVAVRLLEGAVDVEAPAETGSGARITRLAPGQSAGFTARPAAGRMRDFENVALRDIVAESNRFPGRPIRIADPHVAALRVSGRFTVDDSERLARRLARLFDLEIDMSRPSEIVLRAQ